MITIEKAKKEDIESIIDIENKSFSNPWSKDQLASSLGNTYIVRRESLITGFFCVESAADEVHILHMAVHPDFRMQGVGRKIMEELLSRKVKKFFLEVRESNIPAQKLYESFGFKVISKRKKYYQDNNETALIMEYEKNEKL